ncbi:hypothetical protein P7C70_g7776, partial [Phenoliferia sp. Uapishka_3]
MITILFEEAADVVKARDDWNRHPIFDSKEIQIRNLGPCQGLVEKGSPAWKNLVEPAMEDHAAPVRDGKGPENLLGLILGSSSFTPSDSSGIQIPQADHDAGPTPSTPYPSKPSSSPHKLPNRRQQLSACTPHSPINPSCANLRGSLDPPTSPLFKTRLMDQTFGALSHSLSPTSPPSSVKRNLQSQAGALLTPLSRPPFVSRKDTAPADPDVHTSPSIPSEIGRSLSARTSTITTSPSKRTWGNPETERSERKRPCLATTSALPSQCSAFSSYKSNSQLKNKPSASSHQGTITSVERDDDRKISGAEQPSNPTRVNPPITPAAPSFPSIVTNIVPVTSSNLTITTPSPSNLTTPSPPFEPALRRFLKLVSPSLESNSQPLLRSRLIATQRLSSLSTINGKDLKDLVVSWSIPTASSSPFKPALLHVLRLISPSLEPYSQLFLRSRLINTERLSGLMEVNDEDLLDLIACWRRHDE